MAESTLSLSFDDLRAEIGYALGYTRNQANWDVNKVADISSYLKGGLRQFYNPPPLKPNLRPHEWSFMRPTTTLTTVASYSTGTIAIAAGVVTLTSGTFPSFGTATGEIVVTSTGVSYTVSTRDSSTQLTLTDTSVTVSSGASYSLGFPLYNLPDDWGSFIGPLTYRPGTSDLFGPVEVVGEYMIRSRRQANDTYARPQVAAVIPKTFTASTGQRFQISFWPTPDDAYVLTYRYNANPNTLSTGEYPLGGMRHAETILASCLAVAESKRAIADGNGQYKQRFMELLAASVSFDANTTAPDYLGINRDRSEWGYTPTGHDDFNNRVTVNGVVY